MSWTVHGVYLATIVIIFNCAYVNCLRINQDDAVPDKFPINKDYESFQDVEPLKSNKNDVEIIPEDDFGLLLTTTAAQLNQYKGLEEDTILGEADEVNKHRKRRQAAHGYSPLYPQLPSGPPYNPYQSQPNHNLPGQNQYQPQPSYNPSSPNPYQPQPNYNHTGQNPYQPQSNYNHTGHNPYQQQPTTNPYGQNPYQPQPTFNPYGQNPYQSQPSYNPSGQNPYSQRPPQYNSTKYNSSQPGNPNTGFANYPGYNPFTGQNPYNSHSNYPTPSPSIPYRPPNGQYPSYNQTSNYPPNAGSFRPPNATGSGLSTAYPPYNPRPGQNFNNNSYTGQSPYNNNYTNYPPGNKYPGHTLDSTSQRPPYNPSQYPSYNNSRPGVSQWPNATNPQYPNYPGARPSPSYNMSHGQYPLSPYSNNASYPRPPPSSPYYPGTNGQYPSQITNPKYPSAFNPSIPNYPPQHNNQGQNNFYYPQTNNTEYDPRRVPPQNFSYH